MKNIKTEQNKKAEDIIVEITNKSKNESTLLTIEDIFTYAVKNGLSRNFFENYITETRGITVRKCFDELGVLKSTKNEFYATLNVLKNKYENEVKPKDVTTIKEENSDINFAIIANNSKKITGMTVRELLIKEGIIQSCNTNDSYDILYNVGKEPADIKKRLDTLFEKLDGAYPDKVISGLHKDHKKWGETVTSLYRKLGYANGNDFLRAYGYTVIENKGGRTANNCTEIIEELKNRYPGGAIFASVAKLKEANPDLAPKIKSLENTAPQIFGSSLKTYLVKENILSATETKTESTTQENDAPAVTEDATKNAEENTEPANNSVILPFTKPNIISEEKEDAKNDSEAAISEEERKAQEELELKAQEEAKKLALIKLCAERRAQKLCQYCGGTFKGFFKKTCSKCGKKKNY